MIDELRAITRAARERSGGATVAIGRDGRGSAVVIAPGQVLTNAHHLRDRTTSVTFADGRTVQATVAGVDPDGDLAVLTVDTGGVAPIEWGTGALEPGDVVVALARGGHGERVTLGLVSGIGRTFRGPRGRRIEGAVEHTAPLARGSSGSPLLDASGRLVGINTHRLGTGFYLAVPADDALRARVDELARGAAPARRRLGIAIVPSRVAQRLRRAVGLEERDGLLVRAVEDDGAGAGAGLRQGDLLVRAGEHDLRTPDDLFAALDGAGDELALNVVRGVEELTVTVGFATA